jgi:hypothetical protein
MSIRSQSRKPRSIATIAVLFCAVSILTGCGGSKPSHASSTSASTSTSTTSATHAGASQGDPDAGQAAAQVKPHKHPALGSDQSHGAPAGHAQQSHRAKIVKAGGVHHARPSNQPDDDQSSTGAKGLNPCTLVSHAQAQTATGTALHEGIEAPLGPTCIFRPRGDGAEITLALELAKLGQASQALHAPRRFTIEGRAAFCAQGPQHTLVMSVRPGQVLTVTAPCKAAVRLASIVVGRLTA